MKFRDLTVVHDICKERLKRLKQKYPNLDANLYYSLPTGQVEMKAGPRESFEKFRPMFQSEPTTAKAENLLSRIIEKERANKREDRTEKDKLLQEARILEAELVGLIEEMEVRGETQIELRFNDLDFDLVYRLQSDELVDRLRTPQSRASIRIVLGTVDDF